MANDVGNGAAQGAAAGTAVAPGWGTAIGAGLGIVGGLVGADAARKKERDAAKARAQALAQYAGISIPDEALERLSLEDLQSVGSYTPEMQSAIAADPTAMENVSVDPRLAQAQMDALQQLSQVADSGVTDADKASLELIRRQAAGEAQAKSQQILQQMQARGQGGSGAELIAQLQNAQSSADRMNQQALEEQKQMQAARMAALTQQGGLAGNIRSQEYGEQSDLAKARDAINAFNVQNRQSVSNSNVGNRNSAQQMNLANQQNIANSNVGTHNTQQQYNKQLGQQTFQNQMNLANAKAGILTGNAALAQQQAQQQAAQGATIGQGLGQIATGTFNAFSQPTQQKHTGFTEQESNDWLNKGILPK